MLLPKTSPAYPVNGDGVKASYRADTHTLLWSVATAYN
jgi:hypothetical protein